MSKFKINDKKRNFWKTTFKLIGNSQYVSWEQCLGLGGEN